MPVDSNGEPDQQYWRKQRTPPGFWNGLQRRTNGIPMSLSAVANHGFRLVGLRMATKAILWLIGARNAPIEGGPKLRRRPACSGYRLRQLET